MSSVSFEALKLAFKYENYDAKQNVNKSDMKQYTLSALSCLIQKLRFALEMQYKSKQVPKVFLLGKESRGENGRKEQGDHTCQMCRGNEKREKYRTRGETGELIEQQMVHSQAQRQTGSGALEPEHQLGLLPAVKPKSAFSRDLQVTLTQAHISEALDQGILSACCNLEFCLSLHPTLS